MVRRIMAEVHTLGRAESVPLEEDLVERMMTVADGWDKGGQSSLYQDLVSGRPLELDALNGKVVELGLRHGIPTPMNFAATACLRPHAIAAARSRGTV